VLIAEIDGHIVGYTSIIDGYNTDIAAPELFMLDLFVVARWRSRGVGRALVSAVARQQHPGQALLPEAGRHHRQRPRRRPDRPGAHGAR
jgi:predicted acetyltransferase